MSSRMSATIFLNRFSELSTLRIVPQRCSSCAFATSVKPWGFSSNLWSILVSDVSRYSGQLQLTVIQLIGLALVMLFPQIVLWLLGYMYDE